MKIYVGADHGGFEVKKSIIENLKQEGFEVYDVGAFENDPKDDYVDYAIKVAAKVQSEKDSKGILICKSGIGMYQTANKFKGIRAAEVRSVEEAQIDREHHNSNILTIGTKLTDLSSINDIVSTWLKTEFSEGRHERRLKKIDLIEKETLNSNYPTNPRVIPNLLFENVEGYKKFGELFETFSARIHVDIMDGEYVPSFSPTTDEVLESLKNIKAFLAFHLMVKNPNMGLMNKIAKYSNVNLVYTHLEVTPEEILEAELPFEMGLAIKPGIDWEKYWHLISRVKVLLILPIIPGAYGAQFLPEELEKINKIREKGFSGEIHLDGSINKDTMSKMLEYKPDILNVGSAIAKQEDPKMAWVELVKLVIK